MKNISFAILLSAAIFYSSTSATASNWMADACSNKAPDCIHPIFSISDASELWSCKLDSTAFKNLNGICLRPNAPDYWRSDMAAMEEMSLFSGNLSDLVKGKTTQEVVQLIGPPRLTTRAYKASPNSPSGQESCLYFFGFNGLGICLVYANDVCVAVSRVQAEARAIEEAAFATTEAFALGKSSEEIVEYLRHDLDKSEVPATLVFRIGLNREWIFHFVDGKCDAVSDAIVLH